MSEIYVSTDVEVDGPIPGPHSMLSFGSAAYQADKTIVSTFTANLELLPGASGHPETMRDGWNRCPASQCLWATRQRSIFSSSTGTSCDSRGAVLSASPPWISRPWRWSCWEKTSETALKRICPSAGSMIFRTAMLRWRMPSSRVRCFAICSPNAGAERRFCRASISRARIR